MNTNATIVIKTLSSYPSRGANNVHAMAAHCGRATPLTGLLWDTGTAVDSPSMRSEGRRASDPNTTRTTTSKLPGVCDARDDIVSQTAHLGKRAFETVVFERTPAALSAGWELVKLT